MEDITEIINIAKSVFKQLGPGYSEFIYQRAIEIEFRNNNIRYENEKRVSVFYKDSVGNLNTLCENRIDMYVYGNEEIIIELKSVTKISDNDVISQINRYNKNLSYIDLFPKWGIIINFPKTKTEIENKIIKLNTLSHEV